MGFQEVSSLDADVTIAIGKTNKATGKPYPKSAEGYYLGSRKVENKRGESVLHFLQTSKGNLGVWGTTDLNRKLAQAPSGAMVRITSTGTKPTPNGDMYTYKVEVDKTNSIEVADLSAGSETAEAEETYEADDVGAEADDETEDAQEEAFQAAALAAAEKKARIEKLLKGNKSK